MSKFVLRSRVTRRCRNERTIQLVFREKYKVDIRYRTQTEITPRTIATAEAFGLGVDETREFPIADNVEIEIKENDIVYLTGDSGSGKSSILRELGKIFADQCVNIDKIKIDENKPLVDTVGKNVNEAIEILSRVGLNDAFLFIRRYRELSEGQKYRYRLAKLIESGKQIWIADEFCSTLDRDTAKIVAYNVQKFARKLGKALFVATCNDDLDEDLNPSVRIDKRYGKEIKITYAENEPAKECSLMKEIIFEKGIREDWKQLARFHYRNHRIPPTRIFFRLRRKDELCGVIAYSYPPIVTFGRRQAFGRVIKQPELNEKLSSISRVVIHPKYRTIGLGKKIVKESLKHAPTEYTETVAVMARYNPFFERAGMTRVLDRTPEKRIVNQIQALERLGFNRTYMGSEKYNLKVLQSIHPEQIGTVRKIFMKYSHPLCDKHMVNGSNSRGFGLTKNQRNEVISDAPLELFATLIRVIATIAQTKVYLIHPKPSEAQ